MSKISVVINTLNEEKNLPGALSSVEDFGDEVIVVDMKSEDKTQALAKAAGAEVFEHERAGYVEPARNFGIGKAKGDWVLILDADEVLQKSLAKKLKSIVDKPKADYYRLPRKNIIFGKWVKHSRWWPDYNIRFFKKGYVSWSEIIHSVPTTKGRGLDLPAKEKYAVVHNHYQSIEQYVQRLNRYTTEHAKLLVKEGYKFTWRDLIGRPVSEFLSRYFQGEGYKDGLHGLALSSLQAFSELVLYLKVWQFEGFKSKRLGVEKVVSLMKDKESEVHYWQADALVKEGGGLIQRIKRKFRLS